MHPKTEKTRKMFKNQACTSLQFNCYLGFKAINHTSTTN